MASDDKTVLREALARDRIIDIVTIGRRSGEPRRTEIWYVRVAGRYFITGTPGPRSWYANLCARPDFLFCLKESLAAELPARARPIHDPVQRRSVFSAPDTKWYRAQGHTIEDLIRESPLVEVVFD